MPFELNTEKVTDILIWWIEGADGSIDYREEKAVEEVLDKMDYSMETFYGETMLHINALSTEQLSELTDKALAWGVEHFDKHRKEVTLALLEVIASSNGDISEAQREKLDKIKIIFGV